MLDKNYLEDQIRQINDETHPMHSWPRSFPEACERWSEAIHAYFKTVMPYSSFTIVQSTLEAKLEMKNFLLSSGNVSGRIFEDSIVSFAEKFCSIPHPVWTSVPPTSFLSLESIKINGINGADSSKIAKDMSVIIHDWFVTGTAINILTGTPVKWS